MRKPWSTMMARATLLATLLAVLPLLALSGSAVPEFVRDWISKYWPSVRSPVAPVPSATPQFQPITAPVDPVREQIAPRSPLQASPRNSDSLHHPSEAEAPSQLLLSGREDSSETLHGGRPEIAQARSTRGAIARSQTPDQPQSGNVPRQIIADAPPIAPIGYQLSGDRPHRQASPAVAEMPAGALPVASVLATSGTDPAPTAIARSLDSGATVPTRETDQIQSFRQRLYDLGAVYLLLETWGESGSLYRCFCQVAVGGNPNCTRHFEATDSDPLRAIAQVAEQVEQWRSATD